MNYGADVNDDDFVPEGVLPISGSVNSVKSKTPLSEGVVELCPTP